MPIAAADIETSAPPNPHWSKPIRKTIYTLNIGDYAPEIRELTYPLIKAYAAKIGADFREITERKFPEWPVVYEKLQIHQLGRGYNYGVDMGADVGGGSWRGHVAPDWNLYIDADTLINPEMFDVTNHLGKDTVMHNGRDMAGIRWKYDQYFKRDGRNIGSCNWFTVASDWCLDLWRPLDDLTREQAYANINVTIGEYSSGHVPTDHLIDDYTLSRNIARFGLKFTTLVDVCGSLGWKNPNGDGINPFLFHLYNISHEEKLARMLLVLSSPNGQFIMDPRNPQAPPLGVGWGLMDPGNAAELRKKWGLR